MFFIFIFSGVDVYARPPSTPEKGQQVGSEESWVDFERALTEFTPLFGGTDAFSQARLRHPCVCPDECPLGSRLRAGGLGGGGGESGEAVAAIVPTGSSVQSPGFALTLCSLLSLSDQNKSEILFLFSSF